MKTHHIHFKFAWDGIVYNFKTQPNFRIHLIAATLVTLLGFYLSLAAWEWLILVFTFSLVIISEMLNTAIESVIDLLTSEYHQAAKIAKDTSAGMVLMSAFASIVVGAVIFIPHLF